MEPKLIIAVTDNYIYTASNFSISERNTIKESYYEVVWDNRETIQSEYARGTEIVVEKMSTLLNFTYTKRSR